VHFLDLRVSIKERTLGGLCKTLLEEVESDGGAE
jgi:hypothetical protein